MAIARQHCVNHPDRPAIGVCIMTKRPICGECSTRYEGVNYSREGLEMLHAQRAQERGRSGGGGRVASVVAVLASPLAGYLLYLGYVVGFGVMIRLRESVLELMYLE